MLTLVPLPVSYNIYLDIDIIRFGVRSLKFGFGPKLRKVRNSGCSEFGIFGFVPTSKREMYHTSWLVGGSLFEIARKLGVRNLKIDVHYGALIMAGIE